MRLLIVNPNTSEGVTARIAAAADAVALPGDHFVTVSAASGPSLILTEADGLAATEGVLTAVARRAGGVDGIVLASFGDTGSEQPAAALPRLCRSSASPRRHWRRRATSAGASPSSPSRPRSSPRCGISPNGTG
jgi:hypothetical protein